MKMRATDFNDPVTQTTFCNLFGAEEMEVTPEMLARAFTAQIPLGLWVLKITQDYDAYDAIVGESERMLDRINELADETKRRFSAAHARYMREQNDGIETAEVTFLERRWEITVAEQSYKSRVFGEFKEAVINAAWEAAQRYTAEFGELRADEAYNEGLNRG